MLGVETFEDWERTFKESGVKELQTSAYSQEFQGMRGMLADEGLANASVVSLKRLNNKATRVIPAKHVPAKHVPAKAGSREQSPQATRSYIRWIPCQARNDILYGYYGDTTLVLYFLLFVVGRGVVLPPKN